jgi:hypothetical protein
MDDRIERIEDVEEAGSVRQQGRRVLLKSLSATALVMVASMLLP